MIAISIAMKTYIRHLALVALCLGMSGLTAQAAAHTVVRFHIFSLAGSGDVDVELYDQEKPGTVQNFLSYVQSGGLNNAFFHTLKPGVLVQAGGLVVGNPNQNSAVLFGDNLLSTFNYGPITNEFAVGPVLSNTNGTLAMAKSDNDPDSASSQFFFNLGDNSATFDTVNGGYTVFGRVIADSGYLPYFNTLTNVAKISNNPPSSVIVNLTDWYGTGTAADSFTNLPVTTGWLQNDFGDLAPIYRDLFYMQVSVISPSPAADRGKPTIAITSPALAVTRFTNRTDPVIIAGTATDAGSGILLVRYSFNHNLFTNAIGTTNWSATLPFDPGTNTFSVEAIDRTGNHSTRLARTYFNHVAATLTLSTNGQGSITGATNGQQLEVNRNYQVTAVPRPNYILDTWTGYVGGTNETNRVLVSTNIVLKFTMPTNLTLVASFIPRTNYPIELTITGNGKVTGATDGQLLENRKGYRLTATPGVGQLFVGWTVTVGTNVVLTASTPTVTFFMLAELKVAAEFIPNPFIPVKGTYTGFFYGTNEIRHENSGTLSLAVTDKGLFTAKSMWKGKLLSFSGQFGLEGSSLDDYSVPYVTKTETNALTFRLKLDVINHTDRIGILAADGIGSFISRVVAERSVSNAKTNPSPFAGKYTFRIPADPNAGIAAPAGDSFGTVVVDPLGTATFVGTLADETKFTVKVPVFKDGMVPFYLPLYTGQGSLVSRMFFATNPPGTTLSGSLTWTSPANPKAKFYRGGFTNIVEITDQPGTEMGILGARYTPPVAPATVFNFSTAHVDFAGGSLTDPFTNELTIGAKNVVQNLGANKLTLTFTPATGLFAGTVTAPGSTVSFPFKGVILQPDARAYGFHTRSNLTGSVVISETLP